MQSFRIMWEIVGCLIWGDPKTARIGVMVLRTIRKYRKRELS